MHQYVKHTANRIMAEMVLPSYRLTVILSHWHLFSNQLGYGLTTEQGDF